MATFYFDGSDAAPTDPNGVWSNDDNAFDNQDSTAATVTAVGDTSTNYLMAEGTNAPLSDLLIISVKARVRGSSSGTPTLFAAIYTDGLAELLGTPTQSGPGPAWGNYTTLSEPSGGWTWAKIASLEVKIYSNNGAFAKGCNMVEIEVYSDPIPGTIYRIQGFQ